MPSDRTKSVDSSDEDLGRVASCMASANEQWNGFLKFLWNPTDRTVLGRGGKSWGQILIFYAFYYSFLAALFAIAITIVLGTLDPYVPRFQTRLQAPGVSIQPRLISREALTSDINFREGDESSYETYTKQLDSFLKAYGPQNDTRFFENCTDRKVIRDQKFVGNETTKACTFYPTELGQCAPGANYGYDVGEPCILVKVNRIINWFPVGFTDLSMAVGNSESKAPPLLDVLGDKIYNPLLMYVACYGVGEADQIALNGVKGTSSNTKYSPAGIPFKYYPYFGNLRTPQYRSPVVAVKFTNVTRDTDIRVGCKAYAKNIVDNTRMQIGYYNFMLRVNKKKEE